MKTGNEKTISNNKGEENGSNRIIKLVVGEHGR